MIHESPPICFDTFYTRDAGPMAATPTQSSVRLRGSHNPWLNSSNPSGLVLRFPPRLRVSPGGRFLQVSEFVEVMPRRGTEAQKRAEEETDVVGDLI